MEGAEAGGVGTADVDDEVVAEPLEDFVALFVVFVGFFEGGNFGFSEVDSDGDSAGGAGKALGDGDGSVIIEAHSVDEGFVAWQAEHARLLVAGLGVPGDGADFGASRGSPQK